MFKAKPKWRFVLKLLNYMYLVYIMCLLTINLNFCTGVLVNFLQGPAIISMKSIINKIIPAAELG